MHLKGGYVVQAVRWTFVIFCFVIFTLSISLLVVSAVSYSEMRVAFDELGSQRNYGFHPLHIHPFKPEAALAMFYAGMAIGTVFTLISCVGWCGAACLDRVLLIVYAVSLTVVLFMTSILLALVTQLFRDDLKKMAVQVYKGFAEHMYGRDDMLVKIGSNVVDTVHDKFKCCGAMNLKKNDDAVARFGTTAAHYTILYWLESTQWGQIQAKNIGYNLSRTLAWAPESCCVNRKTRCSEGVFGDRLEWDKTKEYFWTQRINIQGCGTHVFDDAFMLPTTRAKLMVIIIVIIVVMIITIVLACWMCYSLTSYEYSSQESDLDKRRHRRRGRRMRQAKPRHRHRLLPVKLDGRKAPATKRTEGATRLDTSATKGYAPATKQADLATKLDTSATKLYVPATKYDTPAAKLDASVAKMDAATILDTPAAPIVQGKGSASVSKTSN